MKVIVASYFAVTNKKKGLMQLKLSEPVKKEVSVLNSYLKIDYFCDMLPPMNFVYSSVSFLLLVVRPPASPV